MSKTKSPRLFDLVQLIDELPSEFLQKGAIGTVVAVFDCPREAYEVEFIRADGTTLVQLALRPETFRLLDAEHR
ncbi:conserved hypothetical protein [Burkholderiales bacterium 8X]|nr:conserved hypothetical protein [Burkholderiales bacterium 8X]